MSLLAYQQLVQLIQNGDPVNEATINRILSTLEGNTAYLKSIFESAVLGSAQFAYGVTVETDALIGQPVYFNAANGRFERALAAATVDSSGELTTTASSHVWGLVYAKHSSITADLLLSGYAPLDLSNAVTGTVTAGLYFLSGTTAGGMQKTSPPVGIPILRSDGDGNVLLRPNLSDIFAQHRHYRFELQCVPAGTHSDPGASPHVITGPDVNVEGWLPAASLSNAPTGAKFGYNVAASAALSAVWPPMPLDSAYLEWNKGLSKDVGGTGVQRGTAAPLVVIDRNGIWWMSDSYQDVPWPHDYDTSSPPAAPVPGADPRDLAMTATLYFTKMQYHSDSTVVTSLRPGSSKVSLTCLHDGATGKTTGDLVVDLDLANLVDPGDDEAGYLVFKDYDPNTQTWFRGPAVDAVVAGEGVLLNSTAQDGTSHRGVVTIAAPAASAGMELPLEEVRLNGVEEENYQDTLGLGFPDGRDSEFRAKFKIPGALSGVTSLTMKLRFQFLARAAGSLPDFTLAYRRIPRPTAATALPIVDSALTLDMTPGSSMAINEYVEIESAAFTAAPGDCVLFSMLRSGSSDGYSGYVHVLDIRPVIEAIS